jgi:hypothetical protein
LARFNYFKKLHRAGLVLSPGGLDRINLFADKKKKVTGLWTIEEQKKW